MIRVRVGEKALKLSFKTGVNLSQNRLMEGHLSIVSDMKQRNAIIHLDQKMQGEYNNIFCIGLVV